MMRQKLLLQWVFLLCALIVGSTNVWATQGDILAKLAETGGNGYATRITKTDDYNISWVLSGSYSGVWGSNSGQKTNIKPTAADLPVVKGVTSNATTNTQYHYFYYTTTPVSNVGSVEFSFGGTYDTSTSCNVYIVMGDVVSANGGDAYTQVELANTSTSSQGASISAVGTYTFTFAETQTSPKYYGLVIKVNNTYKRFDAASLTLKEGITPVRVTSVTLNKDNASLVVGGTETLVATVAPNDATNKNVIWESSDETVATVANGVVTANAAGIATITVTTEDGSKTATCDVTVREASVSAPTIDKESGEYNYNTPVIITTTAEDIMYTTDGTNPYSSPTAVNANGNTVTVYITKDMTLTAISLDEELNYSAPIVREYTVTKPAAPSFSLAAGTYIGSQTVTITTPASTTISYTTDGTDPAESGTATTTDMNSGVVNLTATATIRAITIDANAITSAEASAEYIIITPETMPFEEDFNNDKGDFTIHNISGYESVWTTNSGYIKASSYASKTNNAAESWLISPFIAIAANAQLTFQHSSRYFENTDAMEDEATMWYREHNGDWHQLTIDEYPGNSDLTSFVTATIDLSTLSGKNIQLGFKYLGNTTSAGSWEIKNMVLEAVVPAPTFTISASSADLSIPSTKTVDITLTTNTDGEITATSDDTEIATVALKSAGVYTITAVAEGSATITISAAKSANFKAANATVDVTVTDARSAAGISFGAATAEVAYDKALTPPTFNNPNSLTVSFSSTDEDVATVDGSGDVTIIDCGTTTIKATFAGNDYYKPAEVSYVLTVKNPYQDIITAGDITFSGSSSYCDWTSVANVNSGATYTGNSNYSKTVIQFKSSDSTSGMITTGTAGRVKKVTVTWGNSTSSGRTIDIYGKNAAYSSVSDLFTTSTQGTKLGSIVCGTSTELTIDGNYGYIGIRSNNGALYLDNITIDWQTDVRCIDITSAKYATYCSDYDLDFTGKDVKAYTAKVESNVVKLTQVDKVPANTGVILYADVDATTNYDIPVTTGLSALADNQLVGITAEKTVKWNMDGKYNYILQSNGAGGVVFNKATETGAKLRANRAYLALDSAPAAPSLQIVFDNGMATGISEAVTVNGEKLANAPVYNLSGQRVVQPTKGLYIVNGKKMVIK